MRNLRLLDVYRLTDNSIIAKFGSVGDETCGIFLVPAPDVKLRVIASVGDGWDHVSVSLPHRTPTWDEMEYIKRLFFKDDETAMQLHVPPAEHVNFHPHCLHLWRPLGAEIPRPDPILVGPRSTR